MDSLANSFDRMVQIGLAIGTVCILFYVVIGRIWFRKRRRIYWAGSSVGNALQQLQATARPSIEYQVEEKLKEMKEEDDQGGPDDPGSYYRRQREKLDTEINRASEHKTKQGSEGDSLLSD